MKSSTAPHLNKRVLKINVGFLLSDGPGHIHDSKLDVPESIQAADDLILNSIEGNLRLSRTKEGILVQAHLVVNVDNECSRCLEPFSQDLMLHLEELYAHPAPNGSEFYIPPEGMLDLAPLIRAEVLILMSQRALCKEGCQGLCPECGINLNYDTCTCHLDAIDPRFAVLKELLDSD